MPFRGVGAALLLAGSRRAQRGSFRTETPLAKSRRRPPIGKRAFMPAGREENHESRIPSSATDQDTAGLWGLLAKPTGMSTNAWESRTLRSPWTAHNTLKMKPQVLQNATSWPLIKLWRLGCGLQSDFRASHFTRPSHACCTTRISAAHTGHIKAGRSRRKQKSHTSACAVNAMPTIRKFNGLRSCDAGSPLLILQ